MTENQQNVTQNTEIEQENHDTLQETNDTIHEEPDIKTEENKANWKKFREERERDRKARAEAEQLAKKKQEETEALKAALESLVSNQKYNQQQSTYEGYEDNEETEEQRIEKRIQEALKKDRERQDKEAREKEAQQLPLTLRKNHPDFEKVCTSENLDYLEYHYPEIAIPYTYMPESYDKWESIYRAIKRHVPYANKQEDEKRIERNMNKPQSNPTTTANPSNSGSAWKLSEERRMANWRRMQQDMKNIG